ncbi:hypothetical protein [Rahnella perminowiae]|uniref:hypothetical protein n=1 Tax=Rahnella perminowiae TaxID=2816244 RepID=UPI00215C5D2E|nr:hypothetical protein [Rahnella perminowiae]MCR8998637.1 hypothetical protein [Rahnella perminowiae]
MVQFENSQYVSPVPLPAPKYNAPREVVNCNMPYRAKTPQDIWQFSQDIATVCHIRTRVTPDAVSVLSDQGAESGSPTQRLAQVPSPALAASGQMRPLGEFGTGAPVATTLASGGVIT